MNVDETAGAKHAAVSGPLDIDAVRRRLSEISPDLMHKAHQQQREQSREIGLGVQVPMPEVMDLDAMLERLVFINDGSRVALRGSSNTVLPFNEFRAATAASAARVGSRQLPTAELWKSDPGRITVHTMTFRPGTGEFATDPEGTQALNLWVPRVRIPVKDAAYGARVFLDHVKYLIPVEVERERFLNWLAHIEQFPGVLPHTHYLMVTPQTGIGRNWLASLLARVWPAETLLGFDLASSLNSGFNGPLSRRTLVVVDELKALDTGYSATNHAQQLKALLTTEVRTVNPKFGRQHREFNAARFLMFSQHDDALPLEKSDRRVIVITNPTERQEPAYYAALYDILGSPHFIHAVATYLAQRDLTGFNPSEPAPMTEAKKRAIEASMTDCERALIALREASSRRLMKVQEVTEYLRDCGINPPTGRGLSLAYRNAGLTSCKGQPTILRKQHRVVALREGERFRLMPTPELTMHLMRELDGIDNAESASHADVERFVRDAR